MSHEERIKHQIAQLIPAHMQWSMEAWIFDGHKPGDFLTAVLENNLEQSFGRADETNRAALFNYCRFLYSDAPIGCHGSKENFASWEGLNHKVNVP